MVNAHIVALPGASLPSYATSGAAGMDLYTYLPSDPIVLNPGNRALVSCGINIAVPEGYEAQVRPRSGLAFKHGITVLNTPGTIDSDYRGEVKVILINLGLFPFTINDGDRIAQLVLNKVELIEWSVVGTVGELSATDRGVGGFGSTGA